MLGAGKAHIISPMADTFSYDGVGNITSHVNVFGGWTADNQANYAPAANHMTGIEQNGNPVRSFTYDATGNVETDTVLGVTTEYRYNHEGRMYAVERGGDRLGEYYYNVFGQLVLRIVTNAVPSGWTMYFYDQEGHLIAEYDGISGDLLREYVWLGDTPIAVIEAGVTPTIHYIHTDHIGRPIALSDAGGSFVNESTWVVFGNAWSVTGAVGVDLRFPGQMHQFESGLHYNWNRQYAPSIARYTQPDPLGLVDGPSRYAYVRNDPMQKVDPTGRFAFVIIPGIIVIGEGAISGIAGAIAGAGLGAMLWPAIVPGDQAAPAPPGMCTSDFDWKNSILSSTGEPGYRGILGSTVVGNGKSRSYGPDGYPDVDRDGPHGGGPPMEQGDHSHDWGRPPGGGPPTSADRGPARPPRPDDPPPPKGY